MKHLYFFLRLYHDLREIQNVTNFVEGNLNVFSFCETMLLIVDRECCSQREGRVKHPVQDTKIIHKNH